MNVHFFLMFMTLINSKQNANIIFEFNADCAIESWQVVDDVVMGGKSFGQCTLNEEGNGLFKGDVSIENNGGFSSIRLNTNTIQTAQYETILLRVKGDGTTFQFRVKRTPYERHSYVFNFETSGQWETITIPLNQMTPRFRGYNLDLPNFGQDSIQQVGFLKASKKNASFQLEIKRISLK